MAENEVKIVLTMVDKMTPIAKTTRANIAKEAKGLAMAWGPPILALGALITKSVLAASSMEESLNKVKVVFKGGAKEVINFSEDAAQALGMSQQKALEAAGTFGNLFTAMGIGGDKSAEMSTRLLTLAADLASFNNIDPTVALEKLRAGLVGEVEPLRTLGVNLSAAAVELRAMEMGLIRTRDELTPAIKAQATYALILEQTGNAQGDFARTSNGLANQTRILKAQFDDLTVSLGTAFIPAATTAIGVINDLVKTSMEFEQALDAVNAMEERGLITEEKRKQMRTDLRWNDEKYTKVLEEINRLMEEERLKMEAINKAADEGTAPLDDYHKRIEDIGTASGNAAPTMEDVNKQLHSMGINAGEAARKIEFADVAIRGMTEAMVEETRIRYVLEQVQITNSNLKQEEKEKLLAEAKARFDATMRINDMTTAMNEGRISNALWADIMADGVVTLEEHKKIFGETAIKVGDLNAGLVIMGGQINGLPSQKTVNIDIIYTTLGQPPIIQGGQFVIPAGPGGQHGLDMIVPEGFENDTYPIRASSGERVIIQPRNTYNFTLNQHTSAPGSTVVRDFMMMKGMSRL